MKKSTAELLQELEQCDEFHDFHRENADAVVSQTVTTYLNDLLVAKGLKKADVIRRSGLSEQYGYQIFTGYRVPERSKLLSVAIGMQLTLSETQDLLKHAGYAVLYAKNEWDCVVIFGLCKRMTVPEINLLLYEYEQDLLG